jgi:molybdate transport system substrate-binding protein
LEAAGLTEPGSYYEYARGKVVVWVPKDSKLDLSSGLKALLNPSIKKIAVANPQHAPYGQAAVAAMQKKGIYDEVKQKLVLGENISQTASFVMSGSADVGIVALSLALSTNMKDKGQYVEIPADDYPPLEQACVVLSASKKQRNRKTVFGLHQDRCGRQHFEKVWLRCPIISGMPYLGDRRLFTR